MNKKDKFLITLFLAQMVVVHSNMPMESYANSMGLHRGESEESDFQRGRYRDAEGILFQMRHKDIAALKKNFREGDVYRGGRMLEHLAAAEGFMEGLAWLREQRDFISIGDHRGLKPMHYAFQNGFKEVALFCVTHSTSPMCEAAELGSIEMLEFLVSQGLDISEYNEFGSQPIHTASEAGHLAVLEWLVERGAGVEARSEAGQVPLHYAANQENIEILDCLLDRGADINGISGSGEQQAFNLSPPFFSAIGGGHVRALDWFVEHGVEPNTIDCQGTYLIHCMGAEMHVEVLEWLMRHGADVTALDEEGASLSGTAFKVGWVCVFDEVVSWGCTLDTLFLNSLKGYRQENDLHKQSILRNVGWREIPDCEAMLPEECKDWQEAWCDRGEFLLAISSGASLTFETLPSSLSADVVLCYLAGRGELVHLERLIANQRGLITKNGYKKSFICSAANGHVAILKLLAGHIPSLKRSVGERALAVAIGQGQIDVVIYLIGESVPIDSAGRLLRYHLIGKELYSLRLRNWYQHVFNWGWHR